MRRNIKCSNVKVLECYQSFYNSTDINLIYDKENFSNKNKNYSSEGTIWEGKGITQWEKYNTYFLRAPKKGSFFSKKENPIKNRKQTWPGTSQIWKGD